MPKWGKNILENLTTGMYQDSKVSYREYVQNACDQIRVAIEENIISADDAHVTIFVDERNRYISIEDNATGVKGEQFRDLLGDIANSNKVQGKDLGFRGIGRLCGLAYCKTLVFTSSYVGEDSQSIMTMDAQKMRDILNSTEKVEADAVLETITKFSTKNEEPDSHYFKVEMIGINKENTDLLDVSKVRDYLSFVAPVPYKNTFYYRESVYKHAEEISVPIEEFRITVNGKQILKEYQRRLYEGTPESKRYYDEIFGVAFKDFYDNDGTLIAWMWYGLCRFEKAIPRKLNPMWGIRLRKGNIQIGDNEALGSLFKEARGNSYFIGEVFAISKQLIPNSQRDYFNENEMRVYFENRLREFFYDDLSKLYRIASEAKLSYKRLSEYNDAVEKYEEYRQKGFTDDDEERKLTDELNRVTVRKEEGKRKLEKLYSAQTDHESMQTPTELVLSAIKKKSDSKSIAAKAKKAEKQHEKLEDDDSKKKYWTDSLSKLSKKERKFLGQIIALVVKHVTDDEIKSIKLDIEKEYK